MTNKRFMSEILLQPPGLGRDILRAWGLLVLAAMAQQSIEAFDAMARALAAATEPPDAEEEEG